MVALRQIDDQRRAGADEKDWLLSDSYTSLLLMAENSQFRRAKSAIMHPTECRRRRSSMYHC